MRSYYEAYDERYRVLDCVREPAPGKWDFVYAVAVLHMLVEDADRQAFLRFVRDCLLPGTGKALLCSMGDGQREFCSDPSEAFQLRRREHPSGPVRVAATSCRVVSFPTLLEELSRAGLAVAEQGLSAAPPEFDSLMYVLVSRSSDDPLWDKAEEMRAMR